MSGELEKAQTRRRAARGTRVRISVLLPTLDDRPGLGQAIDSVLGQEYDDFELVIADDHSRGETHAMIERRRADHRVRVVGNDGPPRTITENWNAALEASTGAYVLLLGDDDALLPDSLRRIDALLSESSEPDCLSFDGYRFIPADTIPGIGGSRFENFGYEPENVPRGGELHASERFGVVRDFFHFRNRFPLGVMTMVVIARTAIGDLSNGLFRPPFPDFYAVAALMLSAHRWVHAKERLLVLGMSPNSVASRFHKGEREDALAYLGERDEFPGELPGNPFLNATCRWLGELKRDYPEQLSGVEIDRSQYVARQLWASYRQFSAGAIDRRTLLKRAAALSGRDRLRLARAAARLGNLRYIASAVGKRNRLEQHMVIKATQPTEARTLEEFVADVQAR